jgi:hypothetical protein
VKEGVLLVALRGVKAAIIVLFFCFCLLGSISGIAFASSQNWSEVTRLTGGTGVVPKTAFTIEHLKWRIRWEYYAVNPHPALSLFKFRVFENETEEIIFDPPPSWWTNSTNGTGTRHFSESGTFFVDVISSCDSYTIIIEQDVESIPEFPSWIILPLFVIATLTVIICRNRLTRKIKS